MEFVSWLFKSPAALDYFEEPSPEPPSQTTMDVDELLPEDLSDAKPKADQPGSKSDDQPVDQLQKLQTENELLATNLQKANTRAEQFNKHLDDAKIAATAAVEKQQTLESKLERLAMKISAGDKALELESETSSVDVSPKSKPVQIKPKLKVAVASVLDVPPKENPGQLTTPEYQAIKSSTGSQSPEHEASSDEEEEEEDATPVVNLVSSSSDSGDEDRSTELQEPPPTRPKLTDPLGRTRNSKRNWHSKAPGPRRMKRPRRQEEEVHR